MSTETRAVRRLPLAALHRRLGAELAVVDDGAEVPLRYRPLAEELRTLREGCGLVDRSWIGRLELTGADRQRLLNALATCEVKSLAPGEGAYGFLTGPQGKVLADFAALALADRLWLELPAGREEAVAAHIRKYVLADQVEVMPLADMLPVTLLGPRAAEVLESAAPAAGRPWAHGRARVLGSDVEVARRGLLGAPAYTLWISASLAGELIEGLLGTGSVSPVGFAALEVLRAEAGVPRYGIDFGSENFPQETGLEAAAVSYTKGCYLGQEVVARIHYRGQVHRALRGLAFAAPPRRGAKLTLAGEAAAPEVGAVATVVESPAQGLIGLALLKRQGTEPGTVLALEGGGTATVRELPALADF
jgi:folate-binding protein YgfZ